MAFGRNLLAGDFRAWPGDFRSEGTLLLNPRLAPGARDAVLAAEFPELPDHFWIASSGSGGRLKVIALSRAALARRIAG